MSFWFYNAMHPGAHTLVDCGYLREQSARDNADQMLKFVGRRNLEIVAFSELLCGFLRAKYRRCYRASQRFSREVLIVGLRIDGRRLGKCDETAAAAIPQRDDLCPQRWPCGHVHLHPARGVHALPSVRQAIAGPPVAADARPAGVAARGAVVNMAPAPYYEQDGIVIYHGEALAVLPFLDACSMDCMLTDPPYCSGGYLEAQKNTRAQGLRGSTLNTPNFEWFAADNMSTIGLTWLLRAVMLEARRILRTNRAAFVFTDWRMVPHLVPVIESSGLRYRDMLVWDKGSAGLGVGFKPSHEILLEFAAGTVEYQTMTGQNVLRYRRVTSQSKEHNAQKPVELLRGVLDVAVPHGGIVCDPFMGSGSTLLAAAKSGRLAVGIEIEERYCEIAATRLKQGVLNLFGEATA